VAEESSSYGARLDWQTSVLLLMLSKSAGEVPLREVLFAADIIQQSRDADYAGLLESVRGAFKGFFTTLSAFSLFVGPRVIRGQGEVPMIAVALQRLLEDGFIELSGGISEHGHVALTDYGRAAAAKLAQQ